jgi:hypothetical protein
MAIATLTFSSPINVSCQVGDTVYYVNTSSLGGFTTNSANSVVQIGDIREIQNPTGATPVIRAYTTLGNDELTLSDKFILFSKDNKANLNSPIGYYASLKMTNNERKIPSELFSVATEIFSSSK